METAFVCVPALIARYTAMYLTMPNVYPFCLYVIEIKGTFNLM